MFFLLLPYLSVCTVLTFATAKVQQISDVCKHLHKKLSFLPAFLVYQHVKDQIIYHLVMHWASVFEPWAGAIYCVFPNNKWACGLFYLYKYKTGCKITTFLRHVCVKINTFWRIFAVYAMSSLQNSHNYVIQQILCRRRADVRPAWGRRRPRVVRRWSRDAHVPNSAVSGYRPDKSRLRAK